MVMNIVLVEDEVLGMVILIYSLFEVEGDDEDIDIMHIDDDDEQDDLSNVTNWF